MILSVEYIYIIMHLSVGINVQLNWLKKKKKITDSFTCFYFSVYVVRLFTFYLRRCLLWWIQFCFRDPCLSMWMVEKLVWETWEILYVTFWFWKSLEQSKFHIVDMIFFFKLYNKNYTVFNYVWFKYKFLLLLWTEENLIHFILFESVLLNLLPVYCICVMSCALIPNILSFWPVFHEQCTTVP